jgi:hypothetical protein
MERQFYWHSFSQYMYDFKEILWFLHFNMVRPPEESVWNWEERIFISRLETFFILIIQVMQTMLDFLSKICILCFKSCLCIADMYFIMSTKYCDMATEVLCVVWEQLDKQVSHY